MDQMRELTFGLPPADAQSAKREATAELAHYLDEHVGLRIRTSFGADYRALVDDLVAGRIDAAWLAPLLLLRAERQVRPVLVLQRAGRRSYHGALVARRDSGLCGVRDLAGVRAGWVDENSAAGYVLARALIAEQHPDVDRFLGPQRMLGSHRAVVEAVLDRSIDVGATFFNYGPNGDIVLSGWQEFLGDRAGELGPIAITGSIPGDVIAVRGNLARGDTAALVAALRTLASDSDGRRLLATVFNGADEVVDVRPGEHEVLADRARRAGWRP